MHVISDSAELARICAEFATAPYVTVDTEFLRERTYWSQLCLVQMARPGDEDAVLVDPLADGIDLGPLYALMADERVTKVFHAARQDVEIFAHGGDVIPRPLFDTQVAAMVCGYGEQVGYETLVRKIAKATIDKSSRFTDWSRRPLSEKQLVYAVADVTHLRDVYESLRDRLERTGRTGWVAEEMAVLTDPATYAADPDEAWQRVKARSNSPKFLAVVRALARWREITAQSRDVPRSRVLKDDALLEIATAAPKTAEELSGMRLLQREARKPEVAAEILAAVAEGLACPPARMPRPAPPPRRREGSTAVADLLKVFLKARADEIGVASRLIAPAAEIEALAGEEEIEDLPVLKGWRREVFGADALRLRDGNTGLAAGPQGIRLVDVTEMAEG
ncbi:MAG TPA: ribonuclease D [Paracoccaceae bacterium]|nr:ribonuclease D [Paracoccaceae bacterium]